MESIKLTRYSHGAGCGCKISPALLEIILKNNKSQSFPGLLVGNEHKDDAAVFDLGNGTAMISTTDFFMPIVDDAFDFGRIASVNAISDIYAMGGKPIMAIAILGWPIDKLSAEIASEVIRGSRAVCEEAKIPLAGGHSIDCPEPIFGLAVSGIIETNRLKTNAGAKAGDLIYLTKPIGVGILTTAEKKGLLKEQHKSMAIQSMLKLNSIGRIISEFDYIHSITDVTGFGLAGHLIEMAEASNLQALIHYVKLPLISDELQKYIDAGAVPGGTHRNWKSYGDKVILTNQESFKVIADPQTSGGLLIAVDPNHQVNFEKILEENHCPNHLIGRFQNSTNSRSGIRITIED